MAALGDISEHLDLVRRMARATDVDLTHAMHVGEITNADWSQMVTNCRGCTGADACRDRLAVLERTEQRAHAPDYCENRVTFGRLARQNA